MGRIDLPDKWRDEDEILEDFGYDPDDPVPRDAEGERIMPDPLLSILAHTPVDKALAAEVPKLKDQLIEKRKDWRKKHPKITSGGIYGVPSRRLAPALEHKVSESEMKVLRLLATGKIDVQIGKELFVEASTVKTHIKHMYVKFNVRTRTALVMKALKLGYLDLDDYEISDFC